ncbi:two-component system sensor histidine kinase QseC [Palleronia aestuarii]|uniref:histidine kinase n=1 Tax=Palleronia aestuarii TaxID=568105 RepID=A0A2W7MXC1_9RHOB|nr:ATP-binding protein [Palleronia aestuarii]PZX12805.1 two-component system sensor histidine kinase QseC [Palleronia aestuarii]
MSIRLRLILALVLATGVVWLSAVIWIENSTRGKVEQVLDARLAESARMVSSLLSDGRIEVTNASGAFAEALPGGSAYSHQLSCQIWSLSGTLIGQSGGAPPGRLTDAVDQGYSYSTINGERWRVYSIVNERIGARVMVGDSVAVRDRLVRDVIEGFVLPAAVVLPILAVIILIGVASGLRPLDRLAQVLRARQPTDFSPLPTGPVPSEIRPVRNALNALFERVARARETERDFTAFAAHELKTPLAGLKTQAQIAQIAPDDATRVAALREIETSISRTDRLVRQLLELAAVEGEDLPQQTFAVSSILKDVTAELSHLADQCGVALSLSMNSTDDVCLPRFLFHAAVRNVVENAILASPVDTEVTIRSDCDPRTCRITVEDEGAGIPDDIRSHVTDRFVRGRRPGSTGSGLGLSIVAAATERMAGTIDFTVSERGQMVRLTIPREMPSPA